MRDTPTVSVIVPFRTHGERLGGCLRALSEQTYPRERYRIIVVDNGCDGHVMQRADLDAHVRVVKEPVPGSYAARNRGVVCSDGEILAFTDADCVPAADWLEKGVDALLAAPNAGLVGGRIEVSVADPHRPTAVEIFESMTSFRQRDYIERWQFAATANLFTYRSIFDDVGPFCSQLPSLGDREWGARVSRAGYRLVYAHDASVMHPARRSLRELMQRSARMAGGYFELARSGRLPRRELYGDAALALLPMRVMRETGSATGRVHKLRAVAVFAIVVAVRSLELLRLSSGGDPRWQ